MIPVDQTIFSTTEEPGKGNCLTAVVASLLELPIEEVPYFAENNWKPSETGECWWTRMYRFLWDHGYTLHGSFHRLYNRKPVPETEDEFWDRASLSQCCPNGVDGYYITTGSSPRGWVNGHGVIYKDRKLAHDPHPSKQGIGEIWEIYKITKGVENAAK